MATQVPWAASGAAAPPQRIVSLNLCADQILIDLVDRRRIAAVTHLAGDASVSAAPDKFKGLKATRGTAEDVLALQPDLIIAGAFTTPATVELLKRLGLRVVVVPLPDSVAGVRALIGTIATATEDDTEGAALIAKLDARIGAVQRSVQSGPAPTALVYQINNYVAGRGTLMDEALSLAGFANAGSGVSLFANGQTSLETIVATPPDLLVLATEPDDFATTVGDNLRHPVLARISARSQRMVLPWPLWLCGSQHIATAIEQLAVARQRIPRKAN